MGPKLCLAAFSPRPVWRMILTPLLHGLSPVACPCATCSDVRFYAVLGREADIRRAGAMRSVATGTRPFSVFERSGYRFA